MAQVAEPAVDDIIPELVVKEGEDIDYRVVLAAYLLADLVFVLLLAFAYSSGYWMVAAPFIPITPWMVLKVRSQQQQRKEKAKSD
mmetsp:Transcript_48069/g.100508  ORF Transcript_48069/g.100508 Transcript_48069/m.100508 type:complete len:85 (+) Transcript_48069:2-256(+)